MAAAKTTTACEHCLLPVAEGEAVFDEINGARKVFCCRACRAIYRMIVDEGLQDFYAKRDWKPSALVNSPASSPGGLAEASTPDREALAPFIRGEGPVKQADLLIEGIRCVSCLWLNEKIVEGTRGVLSARINFATHRAQVTWDEEQTGLGAIITRIRSAGYIARPFTPEARDAAREARGRDLLLRFGTAAFFSMQLMLYSFGLYAGFFQGIDEASKRLLEFAALLVCTPVVFYAGLPFLRGAFRGLRNLTVNMDALVSLGALAAYGLSIGQLFTGGEVYFDTSAMIITLLLLGRYLEHSAQQKASEAVSLLLALQPAEARVLRGEERVVLPVSEVKAGDQLEVRPGEKIPLDGVVSRGRSEVDESLVTGESRPVAKETGAAVIGGSLNGLGVMVVTVTRIGRETVLAQIARLVENAQAAAAPIQRIADRVSAWFVPFVIAAAAGTWWHWSRQAGGAEAVLNAVSVLVIACPCALGLATPVAVLTGAAGAARKGILIKGGDVFERLRRVDTVVLDKTGTITTGMMSVEALRAAGGRDETAQNELLQFAASAEQHSEHLIGRAIVRRAQEQGTTLLPAASFSARPGRGVDAAIDGVRVLAGTPGFLTLEGVSLPASLCAEAGALERQGMSVVWVARGGDALGLVGIADAPKPDSRSAIERLHGMGLDVIMITGDGQDTARAVAEAVGIKTVIAGAAPEEKSAEIAQLRASGRIVAMAGDGINDAPALAAADVGMAMASGSDIAVEAADVVLMRPDLTAVAQAIASSRRTFTVIAQNLFWAFFYNAAAIPLAMAGVLSPIFAAGAMALSSVTVVMNSLRLR